jgi:hypothetical protein
MEVTEITMNDANENKNLPWTVRKIRWFKKTYWLQALLSFLILFCLGAVGGFLWSGFTAERIQGGTDEERQAQEHEQDSDMEHAMLQRSVRWFVRACNVRCSFFIC